MLLRTNYTYKKYESPKTIAFYLQICEIVEMIIVILGYYYVIWTKKDSILKVFNWIQQNEPQRQSQPSVTSVNEHWLARRDLEGPRTNTNTLSSILLTNIPWIYLLLAIINVVQHFEIYHWSWIPIKQTSDRLFFFKEYLVYSTTVNNFFNIFTTLLLFQSYWTIYALDCLFIMTVKLFTCLVTKFEVYRKQFKELDDQTLLSVFEAYRYLKQAIILINECLDIINFGFAFSLVSLFFEVLGFILNAQFKGILVSIKMIGFFTSTIAGLVFAARAQKRVRNFMFSINACNIIKFSPLLCML